MPPHPPPMPLSFSGDRGEFFRLVMRGAGLELITVGFYRFWLATDIRRHFGRIPMIDGDAAEYTGRAKELLIGFLIALAIIVPVYLAYFIAGLEAERYKAFASAPLFVVLLPVRTIRDLPRPALPADAHGVARGAVLDERFGLGLRRMVAAVGHRHAIVTLGLILPWREAALERYKMRHSYYGDLQGSFEGRGWEFFKRGWWLWLLAPFFLPVSGSRPLSTPPSRRWSGAGGFPEYGLAACSWNRRCDGAR